MTCSSLKLRAMICAIMGAAFGAGAADVDPKNGLATCAGSYCELAALCRVHERLNGSGDDAGAAAWEQEDGQDG